MADETEDKEQGQEIDGDVEPEAVPRGRRARGPNERWLIEKALEITAPDVQTMLGDPPLDFAKIEALDRTQLNGEQIVILAYWITTHDILALVRTPPALKCGWCLRAAPDAETRAAVPELDGEAEMIDHVSSCQNNPIVRELVALKARLA